MKKTSFTTLIVILSVHFALSSEKIPTPLELSEYNELTSHVKMMEYLRMIDRKARHLSMEIIGESVLSRDIPALFFSAEHPFVANLEDKPTVLIYCQQHGNEPSGKEAALELAGELAAGNKNRFRNFNLILIPMVNPDGAETQDRENAGGMDLNRDHAALDQPETQALHSLFYKYMPEVALDVHEYNAVSKKWVENGYIKNADEMIGAVTNLNIDAEIAAFSRKVIILETGSLIINAGYTFHRYVVGQPFEDERMRYSTTAVNDGRQSMGIYNTFSFILEGKKYKGLLTDLEKRTKAQMTAMNSFIDVISSHAEEIKTISAKSRQNLLDPEGSANDLVHLQMDYFPADEETNIQFPVFDLYEWAPDTLRIENFHPVVKAKKSVPKPHGYVFPGNFSGLKALLRKHHIEMYELAGKSDLKIEAYTVVNLTEQIEEELTLPNVDVIVREEVRRMDKGMVVVYLNQPAGNLIPLLLEPQSTHNLTTDHTGQASKFTGWLIPGKEYPIFRLVDDAELGLVPIN